MSAVLDEDRTGRGDLWAINGLPGLTPQRLLACDHFMIVWINERAWMAFCGYPHLSLSSSIHVDCSDRKMWIPPALNTGVGGIQKQPIAVQFAILSLHIYGLYEMNISKIAVPHVFVLFF